MKKIISAIALAVSLLLMGCPLQTEKSIDNGSYDIPDWLIGKWKGTTSTDGKITTYLIKKNELLKGNIQVYPYDEAGKTSEYNYKTVIFSSIGDKVFVNIFYPSDDDITPTGYFIYKLNKISEREISLIPVKENIQQFEVAPESLKAWLLQHKDDDSIYDSANSENYQKQ